MLDGLINFVGGGVLPIFAVSMTLHGLANILEDLGLVGRSAFPGFHATISSGIN